MISKKAIEEFLNRKLQNFEWVKALSPTQIGAALSELVPLHLTETLWLHQKASLLIMQHHPRFMLFLDMGGGKTLTILTALRHRKLNGEKPRAIIFVPYLTAVDTWINEVDKWAPELKCCPLLGTSEENLIALQDNDPDLFVVCYQTAVAMVHKKVRVVTKKGTEKTVWELDNYLLQAGFDNFDTLICDEIHKVSNHNSLTFELCKYISNRANYAYGLTGTPFGRDLQELWAEFYVIDFGETLGPNISFYRNVFFTRKAGFFGGMEFKFNKKLTKPLQRIVKNKSIHYSVNDFADIPEKLYFQRRIKLPDGIRTYVDKAKEKLIEAQINKDYEVAGNAFMQLRQLSSGFMTFKDDDDRVKIKFDTNPKLDVLCELIESMPPECKMVVFHDYIFTNQLISERLKELKIGHARIWGGQRDQLGQLRKFREDKHCKILVINSRSGSSALNLQFAQYICMFEQIVSSKDRTQAEARVWRSGQKSKVLIYDFIVDNTIDSKIYNAVLNDVVFLKEFLDGRLSI